MLDPWLLTLFLSIAIPALLLATVPRRWRGRVMLLWPLVPFPIYVLVVGVGLLLQPHLAGSVGAVTSTFLMYVMLLIVPWLATCAIGFGLGGLVVWLRARRAPSSVGAAAAATTPGTQADVAGAPVQPQPLA